MIIMIVENSDNKFEAELSVVESVVFDVVEFEVVPLIALSALANVVEAFRERSLIVHPL